MSEQEKTLPQDEKNVAEPEIKAPPLSRRAVLRTAGLVVGTGAVAALTGCGGEEKPTTAPPTKVPAIATQPPAPAGATAAPPSAAAGAVEPAFEPEQTMLRMINPMGFGGEVSAVEVKNGKIVRIRPLHYDEVYSKEDLAPAMWKIEAKGKSFEPLTKATTGYLQTTWKKRVYSPNRILYPLKRVDWEPGGDPAKVNAQNRGKSKFKRISWDEATDIIAGEIKRIQDKYGQFGVMTIAEYIHGESKNVLAHGGCHTRLFNKMGVKYTREIRCTGSNEAGYIGGYHIWGSPGYPTSPTTLDIAQNTEQLVTFGGDWETITSSKATQMGRAFRWFIKDLGMQYVSIDPRLNYSAATLANKWIPILPNTDAALLLGVIHTWLTEGTWDQKYVETHAVGMDKLSDYVLGKEDGVPKTPAWASTKCGVPEWTIKALAREWASKTTSLNASSSGMRTPYCHEYYRLAVIALAMQGLGRPGVHYSPNGAAPRALNAPNAGQAKRAMGLVESAQGLPKATVAEGILNPPISYYSTDAWMVPVENQFKKWQYPIPKEEGGTEIHMMWDESSCHTSCYTSGFRYEEAIRKPTIECYVIQHPTLENDGLLADLILPVTWGFEETDILNGGDQFRSMVLMEQNVPPIGEAKSDYEIAGMIAQKLEKFGGVYADAYNKYTEGKTIEQWIQYGWETSGLKDKVSWNDFAEKGIAIAAVDPKWQEQKSGLIDFYNDPVKNPLKTPSGKLEFYSQRLADNFPDDNERNPLPKWVPGGPGYTNDEGLEGERVKQYPLLLTDTIRRWGHHSMMSDVPWLAEVPTARVKGYDGYNYEPLWMNPKDAAKRGIKNGDIVKIYNERGVVLAGAYVTERIIPGAVQTEHGCRLDPITERVDRGGLAALIGPDKGVSKNNRAAMCSNEFLVEVVKLDPAEMEEWRQKYPEAFARDYDPYYGPLASGWIEGGA